METATKLSWSLDEAAVATGLSTPTLRRCVRSGALKARKIGARVVILNADLESFVREARSIETGETAAEHAGN